VQVVESLGVPRVIMIPDEYLAKNVAAQTKVEIISWAGRCEVHERFTPADIHDLRKAHPGLVVLSHPECDKPVVDVSDFAGSTAAMAKYVQEKHPAKVALITECSMSDNVAVANPDVEFIKPCNLCPHMKRITLPKIRRSLETMSFRVEVPADIAAAARRAVERMVAVGAPK
jgi:quinolinate synthase